MCRSPYCKFRAAPETDLVEGTLPRAPLLSTVVISQNNATTIERTIASIVAQDCPDPFEIILVDSGTDRTVEIVRLKFPGVIVVDLQHPVLPAEPATRGSRSHEVISCPFLVLTWSYCPAVWPSE